MIAVTGANGLLGSFIVRKLLEKQLPFIAVKRQNSDVSLLADVNDRITWRTADVLDPVALEEAMQNVTQVIHVAGMVSFNPSLNKTIYDINVIGTRNVVNVCLHNSVRRLVHISSVAALGRQKGQELINEENKWTESSVNSRYAEAKYFGEVEVFRGQEEGLNTVVINPSVILAPADWLKSSAQLFKYVWDQKQFYIDANLNYVDVRDVSEIVFRLIGSPVEGERFIVNAAAIPFIDFFRMVGAKFGKKPPSIMLNSGTLQMAAMFESLRSKMMGKEPLLTVETARLAGTRFLYSNEKVKKTLNFEFQTIDATIGWCCAHYLNYIHKK
jgi:dihydroflavonol-4-reductase